MRTNKLRTFLTGFAIAWGIFMLIILLGSGNGLRNAMSRQFSSGRINTITIYDGFTSIPYDGLKARRRIHLTNDDIGRILRMNDPRIKQVIPTSDITRDVFWRTSSTSGYCLGVTPDYPTTNDVTLIEGRFINEQDIRDVRKVCVINEKTRQQLLARAPKAVGEYIRIGSIDFQIVGVYSTKDAVWRPAIYMPLETMFTLFMPARYLSNIVVVLNGVETEAESTAFCDDVRTVLYAAHRIAPNDRGALWISETIKYYMQTMSVMNGIAAFVWLIALCTLLAGAVGVSNIMLITVKERTREFGIRKALGATPGSILRLVLTESVFITSFFGYIGMILGILVTEVVAKIVDQGGGLRLFVNPTVGLDVAICSMLLLVITGLIAGYIPARRAVRIKPIEAIRS
jgi:putative ABC transport system permease protein